MASIVSPAIYRFRRAALERWIEEAIDILNTIDGDPDFEDDDREDINECEDLEHSQVACGSAHAEAISLVAGGRRGYR